MKRVFRKEEPKRIYYSFVRGRDTFRRSLYINGLISQIIPDSTNLLEYVKYPGRSKNQTYKIHLERQKKAYSDYLDYLKTNNVTISFDKYIKDNFYLYKGKYWKRTWFEIRDKLIENMALFKRLPNKARRITNAFDSSFENYHKYCPEGEQRRRALLGETAFYDLYDYENTDRLTDKYSDLNQINEMMYEEVGSDLHELQDKATELTDYDHYKHLNFRKWENKMRYFDYKYKETALDQLSSNMVNKRRLQAKNYVENKYQKRYKDMLLGDEEAYFDALDLKMVYYSNMLSENEIKKMTKIDDRTELFNTKDNPHEASANLVNYSPNLDMIMNNPNKRHRGRSYNNKDVCLLTNIELNKDDIINDFQKKRDKMLEPKKPLKTLTRKKQVDKVKKILKQKTQLPKLKRVMRPEKIYIGTHLSNELISEELFEIPRPPSIKRRFRLWYKRLAKYEAEEKKAEIIKNTDKKYLLDEPNTDHIKPERIYDMFFLKRWYKLLTGFSKMRHREYLKYTGLYMEERFPTPNTIFPNEARKTRSQYIDEAGETNLEDQETDDFISKEREGYLDSPSLIDTSSYKDGSIGVFFISIGYIWIGVVYKVVSWTLKGIIIVLTAIRDEIMKSMQESEKIEDEEAF